MKAMPVHFGKGRKRLSAELEPHVVEVVIDQYGSRVLNDEHLLPSQDRWYLSADRREDGGQLYRPKFAPVDVSECVGMMDDERELWRAVNSGRVVLVSGQAGSGKSHLLRRFVNRLSPSVRVALTGPTGVSAFNIGGETIYRKMGLGLASEPVHQLAEVLMSSLPSVQAKFKKARSFFRETDILVLDEISMLKPEMLTKIHELFCVMRNNRSTFGGITVLMFGDFTQLGPVYQRDEEVIPLYECPFWKTMKICRLVLARNFRQRENRVYARILSQLREGVLTPASLEAIRSRVGATPLPYGTETLGETPSPEKAELQLEPMFICPHRATADSKNNKKLQELEEAGNTVHTFEPHFSVGGRTGKAGCSVKPSKADSDAAHREIATGKCRDRFPFGEIRLAVGAQVVMKCNELFAEGIFSGSMGIVHAISAQIVHVRFLANGRIQDTHTGVERFNFTAPVGDTAVISMSQFPLMLAWAGTIHSTQGLTLPMISADVRHCFEAGQLYVAMSRVPSLEAVTLLGFDPQSIIVNHSAVEFETGVLRRYREMIERPEVQEDKD